MSDITQTILAALGAVIPPALATEMDGSPRRAPQFIRNYNQPRLLPVPSKSPGKRARRRQRGKNKVVKS